MNNTVVSIVIPNYNKGEFVRRSLGSVLAQTHSDWEVSKFDERFHEGVVVNRVDEENVARFSRERECAEYLKLMEQVCEEHRLTI